jgi:hypothetical protein
LIGRSGGRDFQGTSETAHKNRTSNVLGFLTSATDPEASAKAALQLRSCLA